MAKATVSPCGGRKTCPRISTIVQITINDFMSVLAAAEVLLCGARNLQFLIFISAIAAADVLLCNTRESNHGEVYNLFHDFYFGEAC